MKHLLLCTILIVLLSATCVRAQTDCKQFRNGKYKSTYKGKTEIIERTDAVQKETFIGDETNPIQPPPIILLDVKWTSDCSYTLTMSAESAAKYPKLPKNAYVTVTIFKTTPNSYTQRSVSNMSKDTVVSEYVRVK